MVADEFLTRAENVPTVAVAIWDGIPMMLKFWMGTTGSVVHGDGWALRNVSVT